MPTFIPLVTEMSIPTFVPNTLGVSIWGVPFKLVESPN